jgi:hypothetical protein
MLRRIGVMCRCWAQDRYLGVLTGCPSVGGTTLDCKLTGSSAQPPIVQVLTAGVEYRVVIGHDSYNNPQPMPTVNLSITVGTGMILVSLT